MDANIARMWIDKQAFEVLYVDFNYHQHKDLSGKPVGDIRGGIFSVTIESSSGPKYNLLTEWMLSADIMHNGVVRFYRKDGLSKMFDFEFYDGHCINYHETFYSGSSFPMTTTISISCAIIRLRDVVIEKKWKVSDLSAMVVAEEAPELTWISVSLRRNQRKMQPEWWPGETSLPLNDESFSVELTDGSIGTGKLDSRGSVRFNNIPPGSCTFSITAFYEALEDWMIKTVGGND